MEEICRPLVVENFFSIKLFVIDWTNFSAKPFVHLSKYNLNSTICNARKTPKCLYWIERVFSR